MKQSAIPRVVIAATSSGSGKTTIVTGILASFRKMGIRAQSYKIGPDYIDPGYHQLASGKLGHNLDTWLVPEEKISDIFFSTAKDSDIAVIEGVMGLYDGGRKGVSSTAAIAKQLGAPVILVIDVKSMGDSAAAVALGFREYDRDVNFAGVILNRVGSATHKVMICEAMERLCIPVLGCIARDGAMQLPERHLGLTPVTENDAQEVVARIQRAITEQVDLTALREIAQSAPPLCVKTAESDRLKTLPNVTIAVAQDEAFSFYYTESLSVLEEMGAKLLPFSPLKDEKLPDAADGLIVGGGFPEMFAAELAANDGMRATIAAAGERGLPIYAECGGLMYLTRRITDFSGQSHDMVGLIPAECKMNDQLQTVGYIEAEALADNLLCAKGALLRGHEFHFSSMAIDQAAEEFPWAFHFTKVRTNAQYPSGYARENILASYLHLHFAGNRECARNLIEACQKYAAGKRRME